MRESSNYPICFYCGLYLIKSVGISWQCNRCSRDFLKVAPICEICGYSNILLPGGCVICSNVFCPSFTFRNTKKNGILLSSKKVKLCNLTAVLTKLELEYQKRQTKIRLEFIDWFTLFLCYKRYPNIYKEYKILSILKEYDYAGIVA